MGGKIPENGCFIPFLLSFPTCGDDPKKKSKIVHRFFFKNTIQEGIKILHSIHTTYDTFLAGGLLHRTNSLCTPLITHPSKRKLGKHGRGEFPTHHARALLARNVCLGKQVQ